MSNWSDEELRRLAFDYVRGELSMDESEAIESRMAESKQFEDYVKRLSALMRGAKEAPPELHHSMDADALFGRIAEHIHASQNEVDESKSQDASEDEIIQVPRRRPWGLLTLAAACVCGLLIWVVMAQQAVPAPVEEKVVVTKAVQIQEIPEPKEPAKSVEMVTFGDLKARDVQTPGVRVFAGDTSNFTLEGELERRLTVEQGTVLVEYLPRKGERLSVFGKGFRVQVTGTVFYVSDVNDGVVGVVTGSVLVVPDQGTPIAVRGGQEYMINEGLRAISPEHFEDATQHVTVEEHLDRLAMARTELVAEKAEAPKRPKKVASKMPAVDRSALREEAQKAMQERRYEDASALMERLLEQVPASDPIAGATRLDLARIYLQRLNQPQKAAFHLKRFVLARPSDAATPSAKAEFCRITHESGRSDALCLP